MRWSQQAEVILIRLGAQGTAPVYISEIWINGRRLKRQDDQHLVDLVFHLVLYIPHDCVHQFRAFSFLTQELDDGLDEAFSR